MHDVTDHMTSCAQSNAEGWKYVRLQSLDLICDHPNAFQEWIDGVSWLCVYGHVRCYWQLVPAWYTCSLDHPQASPDLNRSFGTKIQIAAN